MTDESMNEGQALYWEMFGDEVENRLGYIADAPEHYLEWTVRLRVHKIWVRDGFSLKPYDGNNELTPEEFLNKLQYLLEYAHEHEVVIDVLTTPSPEEMEAGLGWNADGAA